MVTVARGWEEFNQLIGRLGDGVIGCDGAIRHHLHPQSLAGGAPFCDSSFVNGEIHTVDGHEHRIDLKKIDGAGVFAVAIHRAIAHATLDVHFKFEAVALADGGDHTLAVDNLNL